MEKENGLRGEERRMRLCGGYAVGTVALPWALEQCLGDDELIQSIGIANYSSIILLLFHHKFIQLVTCQPSHASPAGPFRRFFYFADHLRLLRLRLLASPRSS
jgi:hypothetical protein